MMSNKEYKKREADLVNALESKVQPMAFWSSDYNTTRKKESIVSQEQQTAKYKKIQSLRDFRYANGMDKLGYLKSQTQVLLDTWPTNIVLAEHPMFHGVPQAVLYSFDPQLLDELETITIELKAYYKVHPEKLSKHRYGANEGVNMGISISPSAIRSRGGYSGGVHYCPTVKADPLLRARLYGIIQNILEAACGHLGWYKRMVFLCNKLNKDSGETRTLPGLPISGAWVSLFPHEEAVHCDENLVGPAFVFTTVADGGSYINCCMAAGEKPKMTQLQPGMLLAGTWAQYGHCNTSVDENKGRTSWTLYLDGRVFCKKYKYVEPKGFLPDK